MRVKWEGNARTSHEGVDAVATLTGQNRMLKLNTLQHVEDYSIGHKTNSGRLQQLIFVADYSVRVAMGFFMTLDSGRSAA